MKASASGYLSYFFSILAQIMNLFFAHCVSTFSSIALAVCEREKKGGDGSNRA
jgi:hypothetical protein